MGWGKYYEDIISRGLSGNYFREKISKEKGQQNALAH